jgi:hypothetical protein
MGLSNEVGGYLALLRPIKVELTGGLNQAPLGSLAFTSVTQQASAKFISRQPYRRFGALGQLAPHGPVGISAAIEKPLNKSLPDGIYHGGVGPQYPITRSTGQLTFLHHS